jgi:tRNA nucleotidyltransferase (CCA-adding enzyme)
VGGAVREQLLGLSVKEHDWVVVGATPGQMLERGYRQVGKDFPVFLHPKTHDEYALARTERKTGPGYKGFSCYAAPDVTLEDDLLRRDLTINAMAQDQQGNIIDPYGGQQDIKKRLLRHVSPAFAEDPVRILRVARFAARYASLGFTVAEETLQLMQKMVRAGEVNALVIERVWQELQKALTETQPQRFFEVLRACGALKILFPEIDNLFGVPASPQWHPEVDTGIHTLMVLKRAAELSEVDTVRFAALMHDLGKGLTTPDLWPKHHGHDEAGVAPIKTLCQRYRASKDYQELAVLVSRYHTLCHKIFEAKPSTALKLLEQLDAYRRPQRFEYFLLACQADAQGRTGFEQKAYPQRHYLLSLYNQTAAITAEKFIAQGLQGLAIKQALHNERLRAIKAWLKDNIALMQS